MRTVLVDTGPLVAYLDQDDPSHGRVVACLGDVFGMLCTTSAVITEAMHLLEDDRNGPRRLAELVQAADAQIFESTQPRQLFSAVALMSKYANVPMDFADATLVLLGDEIDTTDIVTLDRRGFSAYRTGRGKPFQITRAR